jgi:Tfp pilus assembly protein PilN
MRAVNLLPRDAGRNARKTKPVALVALAGGVLLVAGLGGGFVLTSGAVSQKEEQLAIKQVELAATPRPEPAKVRSSEDVALAGQRGPRVTAVSAALASRVSWDRILRRFSLVLPDDIWLQSLTATAPGAPSDAAAGDAPAAGPAPAAESFQITGRTYSHDGVARLLARLAALPDLENVQLQTSHRAEAAGQTVVEFTIVAGVRADGASA